jgi:predicted lipoprotein with Yx(FWY)xxD motif
VKRISIPLAAILAVAVAAVAAAATPTVKLANTHVGRILVNGRGFTLYAFSRDGHNKDVCVTKPGCTMTWPPLTTITKPTAGPGLKGKLLGTIKLPNGSRQVTYAGHPLYRYAFDSRGTTDYVGISQFGGEWDALTASGKVTK